MLPLIGYIIFLHKKKESLTLNQDIEHLLTNVQEKRSLKKNTWNPNMACNQSKMSNGIAFAGFLDDGHDNELVYLNAATAAHIWYIDNQA